MTSKNTTPSTGSAATAADPTDATAAPAAPASPDEESLVDMFWRDRSGREMLVVIVLAWLVTGGWIAGLIPGIVVGVAAAVLGGIGVAAFFLFLAMGPWSQT